MIAGILLTVVIVIGVMFLRNKEPDAPVVTVQGTPASVLEYCSDEGVKPCVVSFGLDMDGNMLVNLILPENSFPNFYLKIARGGNTLKYICRRVGTTPLSAYCFGEKLPPGELLHLMLFSIEDDALLSEGDLSIIGLALPTLAVVTPTFEESTPTEETAPLMTEEIPTESPTPIQLPPPATSTPTPLSYPNPTSYPNPSYP